MFSQEVSLVTQSTYDCLWTKRQMLGHSSAHLHLRLVTFAQAASQPVTGGFLTPPASLVGVGLGVGPVAHWRNEDPPMSMINMANVRRTETMTLLGLSFTTSPRRGRSGESRCRNQTG